MKVINAAKEHKAAAIFEAWAYDFEDDWEGSEDYRIEFDGTKYDRTFHRRCDASRFAGRRAEIVEHWYLI